MRSALKATLIGGCMAILAGGAAFATGGGTEVAMATGAVVGLDAAGGVATTKKHPPCSVRGWSDTLGAPNRTGVTLCINGSFCQHFRF